MAATDTDNSDLARAEILWNAADALRGQIDAAEYKHVVLGLLFLKYISDSFDRIVYAFRQWRDERAPAWRNWKPVLARANA